MCESLFTAIEGFGVSHERLKKALDQHDNWGGMVHSFEYLTVLGVVEGLWRKHKEDDEGL